MRLHIITIGQPKLEYAKLGWHEYFKRLSRYHDVRTTHLADKYAEDSAVIDQAIGKSYLVVLEIEGRQLSSPELASFLETQAMHGRELAFVIGGPNGLPADIRLRADLQLSFGRLTLPHDLAMVTLLETLYRASTINAGHPYHR